MHSRFLNRLVSFAALALSLTILDPLFAADCNLAGTWKATFTTQNGRTVESTLKLKQDGDKLSGVVIGRNGNETPLEDIALTGDQVSFKLIRERNGEKVTTKVVAKLAGDELKGKLESNYGGENRTLDWQAKREKETADTGPAPTGVTGNWRYQLNIGGNDIDLVLSLKQDGDKVTGKVSVADFELPISEGKVAGNAISFTVAVDRDGLKFTSKYKGTVEGDKIKGKIHSDRDGQDHEYDWNATREKAVATSSSATGLWKWVIVTDSGDSHDLSLKLKQDGEKLTGVVILGDNEIPISDGLVKDSEVSLKVTREQDGKTQLSTFKGTLEGDTIKGKIDSDWTGEKRTYPWNAKRSS